MSLHFYKVIYCFLQKLKRFMDQNFSIILPTFHEAKNILNLLLRIGNLDMGSHKFEVIIVDDNSNDGIETIVSSLQSEFSWLRIIIRQGQKSLSTAVIEGIKASTYPLCLVMDADLSHPPEKILELITELTKPNIDFVIGSRYINGGTYDQQWPWVRRIISKAATKLATHLISIPITDPLSGFIAFKKSLFTLNAPLRPIGFKIGLEILVRSQSSRITEVPIHFADRKNGKSKLRLRIMVDYLLHLIRLYCFKYLSKKKTKKILLG
jgi:dolichol-phosphate mannosyltransferase